MIAVYTGPRHSGKTTRLAALCREWRAAGRRVDGFLSPAVLDKRDEPPAGYDLFEIKTEAVCPFLRRVPPGTYPLSSLWAAGERQGRWVLVPDGLARAAEIIRGAAPDDLLVVDEFGPLELRGGGVRPAFDEALRAPGRRVLVVVREALRGKFLKTYAGFQLATYDALQPGAGEDLTRDLFGGAA